MRLATITRLSIVTLVAACLCCGGVARAASAGQTFVIRSIGPAGATVTLATAGASTAATYTVGDQALRVELSAANLGDELVGNVDPASPQRLATISQLTHSVGVLPRLAAMGVTVGLLLLVAAIVTNWRPQQFLIGVDNRYSNSQCQVAFWFTAVATAYGAAVVLRVASFNWGYLGGVGIPEHLAELTGLSALTFGGAKVITTSKLNTLAAAGAPALAKPSAARPNLLRDLVSNDSGRADIGDFQMMLVTLVAVAIFLGQAFHFLGLLALSPSVTMPDVDTTLLASFGIGQGAYLIKKAASNPGEG